MSGHGPLPPVPTSPPSTGGVRRHHTISSSSRTARTNSKDSISEETPEQHLGHDDEFVDQDWVGGVGAVGEKSTLHRQSSLPTRYHQRAGLHGSAAKAGNMTPKTVNSLQAIAGHEGDEDEDDNGAVNAEHPHHQQVIDAHAQSTGHSPLSPHFAPAHIPSPPPAGPAVRRHTSLTYGGGGPRQMPPSGLKRSGTLQAQNKQPNAPQAQSDPDPPNSEEDYADDDDYYANEAYYARSPGTQQQLQQLQQQQMQAQVQAQYPPSSIGRSSPWNSNGQGGEWRTGGSMNNTTIDDVQRALSTLEIASDTNQMYHVHNNNFQMGQSAHPPRFNPTQPPPPQAPGLRSNHSNTPSNGSNSMGNNGSSKLHLVTDFDGRKTPLAPAHPVSAAAYVPVIGHSIAQQQQQQLPHPPQRSMTGDDRISVAGAASWDVQKDRSLGSRVSNSNLQYGYQQQAKALPSVPPIPQQYLQQQQQQQQQQARLGVINLSQERGQNQGFINSPIDVPSLIAAKGYNPINFDVRPQFARFFVIKSYTEDDVHKSLKYEIWSSTDPGNKRLDKAFKETAGRGPIYLFFSVNASGHFCGMAEMLTPVDYTRSSTVWASDKWKGVFKVRWIFVRDIPNVNLRHIKLNNTQERKPVTNSRDTQELLPDAGQEMLRIFHTHQARTSLLQDFAFYELQAMQKSQAQGVPSPPHSPVNPPQTLSPANQNQQTLPFNMVNMNSNALAYQMSQMTPMMQMQLQMNMGMGSQFGIPQAQAMHQSVLRHPSPGPPGALPVNGQGFMSMPGF